MQVAREHCFVGTMARMRAKVGSLEFEYETFGKEGAPPVVLVQGFAQQLIRWDERFCARLAELGFRVIRFDNRDVGLSTKLESAPLPNLPAILGGDRSSVAYSIEDMADDAAGLIDALGLGPAHVVGISMGGMIVQTLAIRHPARVRSLASIMSTTGNRRVGQASSEALAVVMRPPSREREANIESGVAAWRALSSPGYPFDEQGVRAFVARAFDRCFYPQGAARQMAAIASQPDRTEALRRIRVPTVVVHGADDPLVHVSGGEATAGAIEGARLVVVPGMGHDMPEGVWPVVLDAIASNAARN
jgi:pimeloyl-ACP methyl ester carboxylesterase